MDELMDNLKKVNPKIKIFQVSAKTGEGMEALLKHIGDNIDTKKRALNPNRHNRPASPSWVSAQ